jgi:hypothetical protein
MAAAHSTLKARSGRNPSLKTGAPKSANRAKAPAQGPTTTRTPESEVAVRGARVRVRGRLQEMIQAELRNLGRAESVLRCLALSMDCEPLDPESPYYPDVVEVVGDLVKRSLVDLDVLYDGHIPHPLLAARKIER